MEESKTATVQTKQIVTTDAVVNEPPSKTKSDKDLDLSQASRKRDTKTQAKAMDKQTKVLGPVLDKIVTGFESATPVSDKPPADGKGGRKNEKLSLNGDNDAASQAALGNTANVSPGRSGVIPPA